MCKLTILHYKQCGCGARDETTGAGFMVTKNWHSRLCLDLEAVPSKRCTQAKISALSSSHSNTTEFPQCHDVKVKTIRFEGEVCFRCLTRRRILEKTQMIKTLLSDCRVFMDRYLALKQANKEDAKFTRNMRQTIKESLQIDQRNETQRKSTETDWEARLHKHLACRQLKKRSNMEKKAEEASGEEAEKAETRKQTRLASLHHHLAQVSNRAVSSAPNQDEKTLPVYEEEKKNLRIPGSWPQRLRIVRPRWTVPTRTVSTRTVSTLDAMPSVHSMQSAYESGRDQSASNRNDTINHTSDADNVPTEAGISPTVTPTSVRGLTAQAPEFSPFQQRPPTEPQLMRAPTAPRAIRDGRFVRPKRQPRQQSATYNGYPTYPGW